MRGAIRSGLGLRRIVAGGLVGSAALGAALLIPAETLAASARAAPGPAACAQFATYGRSEAEILTTRWVPAEGGTPAYCKVSALIRPQLRLEVRLPATWNGKLHYAGSGGFGGQITPVSPAVLAQGYASVASNSGHDGKGATSQEIARDMSFARDDATAVLQLALLSVPTAAAAAKRLTGAYYGRPPAQTYFEGCSQGGREGVVSALRFPSLFDGIIAGAPGLHMTATFAFGQRNARLIHAPGAMLSAAKLKTLNDAVLRHCDTVAADGLVDGIVSNWAACRFDPATLRCPGGAEGGDGCLSDPQLAAVNALANPFTAAKGALRFGGYPLNGTQGLPGEWDYWEFAPVGRHLASLPSVFANLFAKDPGVDALAWDLEANALTARAVRDLFDVNDADLRAFQRAGGKLILWQGAGDPTTSTPDTVTYYEDVVRTVGGRASADSFARLYVAGGVSHCRGGPGADSRDALLPALDAWVTKNAAPGPLAARRLEPATGRQVLSRPLCPFPAYARYRGQGDPAVARSFVCATP
ncbi:MULTISPECIES: tannase/feruloyl esterase family alpha/beta hydrolase [unclassified Phenylobacterium]|uniref:tannase/feruloyl esterase family alpha/beta hydrolase n=1 Tax=unclassified Phenylobacterium TaxID=2640670 RepID=UPI00083A3F9D|nr:MULTISPECIES: tannase/feruloyl esterase family alpha/beta hydrolase [unclassified Phenylobacterium]